MKQIENTFSYSTYSVIGFFFKRVKWLLYNVTLTSQENNLICLTPLKAALRTFSCPLAQHDKNLYRNLEGWSPYGYYMATMGICWLLYQSGSYKDSCTLVSIATMEYFCCYGNLEDTWLPLVVVESWSSKTEKNLLPCWKSSRNTMLEIFQIFY